MTIFLLSFVFDEVAHHRFELVEVYLTIAVQVHFFDNFLPDFLIFWHVVAQDLSNLLSRDTTATILVKQIKGSSQVSFVKECSFVDGGSWPFAKVDAAIFVNVSSFKKGSSFFCNLSWVHRWINFLVGCYEFLYFNLSVTIQIEKIKCLTQLLLFFFCRKMRHHECDWSLL